MRHWIFIRGLGRESSHWGEFVPQFRKAFPHDQVELLDLAGNGSERHKPSFLSIFPYHQDLRKRSQWIQQGHQVYLMTISLASMVAVDWATQHPWEIAGVVMMNTSDRRFSKFYERMQPHNLRFLTRLFQQEEEFTLFPGTSRGNFFRQMLAASRYSFPQQKPPVPLLLLSSLRDQLCNPICSANIAQAWQLPHRVHATATHDIPLDDSAWVIEQTKTWLAEWETRKVSLNIGKS
jgi:pimeloyl-ACP methyl ester carboxylesterase